MMFLKTIKELFKKQKTFECIIWDGKTMQYQSLTQKQIENLNNNPEYKDWTITIKDEC